MERRKSFVYLDDNANRRHYLDVILCFCTSVGKPRFNFHNYLTRGIVFGMSFNDCTLQVEIGSTQGLRSLFRELLVNPYGVSH